MRHLIRPPFVVLLLGLIGLAAALVSCSGADEAATPPVTIATGTPAPTVVATQPPPVVTQAPATVVATQPPVATAKPVGPPNSGRWIDVNVSNFTVRLMNGTTATQVIGPVGVGAQVDTGAYESTQTGLFHVYNMDASLTYDAPYHTYISHWVGFDPDKANGFHSFLKDADGNVVDPSTGRISNGCIRTGSAEAIYAFAEIGMPVYVHA